MNKSSHYVLNIAKNGLHYFRIEKIVELHIKDTMIQIANELKVIYPVNCGYTYSLTFYKCTGENCQL